MKGYEDELERLNARSESRTRENSYRDKMIKLEDTIIRPKLNSDVGSRNIKIEIKPTYLVDNKENMNMNNVQQKYSSGNKSVYEMNRMNAVNTYEEPKSPKKGSWRKDIARYEEDLELKKIHKETQRKMDSYNTNDSSTIKDFKLKSERFSTEKFFEIPVQVIKTGSEVPIVTTKSIDSCTEKSKPTSQCTSESEAQHKMYNDVAEKTVSFTVKLDSFSKCSDIKQTLNHNSSDYQETFNIEIKSNADKKEAKVSMTNNVQKDLEREKERDELQSRRPSSPIIDDDKAQKSSTIKSPKVIKNDCVNERENISKPTTKAKPKPQETISESKLKKSNIKTEKQIGNSDLITPKKGLSEVKKAVCVLKSEETESKKPGLNSNRGQNSTKGKETNILQKSGNQKDRSKHKLPLKPDRLEQSKGKMNIVEEEIPDQKLLDNQNKSKINVKEKDENYHAEDLKTSTKDLTNSSTQNENKCGTEMEQFQGITSKVESKNTEDKDKEPRKEDEEEEEEDLSGMKTIRKETDNKFADMEAEFEAGRSKLAALRARIRKARENSKASSDSDSISPR